MYFIDNAVLISAVQHSDFSYTRVCVYIYIYAHILFHYGLSEDTEYSYLC